MERIEPRFIPTLEDLKVWEETTRRMLDIPQRTVDHRGSHVVVAAEIRLLEALVRLRTFVDTKGPKMAVDGEARLLAKRLSQIAQIPIEVRIAHPTEKDLKRINVLREFMKEQESCMLPCPFCAESLRYHEEYDRGVLLHPYETDCLLASRELKTRDDVVRWNRRERLEQPVEIQYELEGIDLEIAEINRDDERLLRGAVDGMMPCPFCDTHLVFDHEHGMPSLKHLSNGCFLDDTTIGLPEDLDAWNRM